ncbi:sporulation YhaL family protein [Jeotgalibacillus campisalis]|uniref:Uncharacterized protein n=1 Tax=Jeotgalibacillus campisalis TaxID=220754 RepID=A0A0C2VD38_9BACL|nr:sporulation YhaL family protein [Jeotgalibacillus campisalis]KIL46862.1 hypothetical protein KR50_25590 [Jeotgalibacillus campisalis]
MFPIWIDLIIGGIAVSAVMAVKAAYVEKKVEKEWIEEHGQTYIKRMIEEKQKRLAYREEE